MADYHAILKRAISGLPSPSGEARRAIYEKARTALVNQLKSFDPPLPASEITQQRLHLEDAIRKVESEAAKGLLRPSAQAAFEAAPAPTPVAVSPEPSPPEPRTVTPRPVVPPPEPGTSPSLRSVADQTGVVGAGPAELVPHGRDALGESRQAEAPGTAFGREEAEAPTRREVKSERRKRRKQADMARGSSRLPLVVGLAVAIMVIGVGVVALWTQRDEISAFFGGSKTPILDMATRNAGEKLAPKSSDRLGSDDASKPNGTAKAVPTQTITTTPQLQSAPGIASSQAPKVEGATPLPQADVALVSQKATLYEEGKAGGGQAQISPGKVVWQAVPDPTDPKPGAMLLKARIEIPDRNIVVLIQMHPNGDTSFPASHLVEIKFLLPPDFEGKSVTNVPGLIMKATEQSRGDPLSGASAKVADNFFWIALGAAEADKTRNFRMLKERGWLDLPFIYGNNRRAILTLEMAGSGNRAMTDAFAAWGLGD